MGKEDLNTVSGVAMALLEIKACEKISFLNSIFDIKEEFIYKNHLFKPNF
ncbi:MAG: hypothetical protein Q8O03_02340 [Nanoarchaeota archaeon]|nr:hypothetical protein [Nanoarchaeota archaeon]